MRCRPPRLRRRRPGRPRRSAAVDAAASRARCRRPAAVSEPGAAAFVGRGSKLDGPERRVRAALEALDDLPRTRLVRHSRLYRTAPWGRSGQPDFVNAVAEVATALGPRALLDALLAIELAHGRRRDGTR